MKDTLTEKPLQHLEEVTAETNWEHWLATWNQFSDDFMEEGREQPPMQERDSL